jgi:hypothetical protein
MSRKRLVVLQVEILLRKGKALGSEESKGLEVDFLVSRRHKLTRGFTAYDRNYDINV